MKRKIAALIVRFRLPILLLMLALAVWSVPMIGKTNINYDLNRYLSDDTMTKRALNVMQEEFGSSEQLRLMFSDRTEEELSSLLSALNDLPQVRLATHDAEKDTALRDGVTWQLITLTLTECDTAALVTQLRGMFPQAGEYFVGGSAAAQLDAQESVAREIPQVMVISVIIVVLVLLLTSHAWLEPAVLLAVLAISILINMGTNFVFPDVSFITFAVCAILQLALSIDYAIMLLHTWNGCCDAGLSPREAMTEALAQCFMRIASSALTTAAGLLSLLFMSFTIGFDIGMVLSKGIVISMLGVFLLMPAVTLLLEKPLRRTRHKPLKLGGRALARCIEKARRPLAAALILAVILGAYLTANIRYTFTASDLSDGNQSAAVTAVFGSSSPVVLLVPGGEEDKDYDQQRELVRRLREIPRADGAPAIGEITAMVTTGAAALTYYSPEDVAEMTGLGKLAVRLFFAAQGFGDSVRADQLLDAAGAFAESNESIASLRQMLDAARSVFIGPRYARLILEPAFRPGDADFNACMESILAAASGLYGDDYYVTGMPMSNYDISNAFQGDLLKVNLITLAAILLIVILSFRALRLPLLLVFVIEGAIWITMGISRLMDQPIFFISYLICLSIQMGATIDYGILLCDQYRALRESLDRSAALGEALQRSLPTILTSGVILVTAGYIIGRQCSVYYISSIGLLLSRGALISALLVLTLLPALLSLADRLILRRKSHDYPQTR